MKNIKTIAKKELSFYFNTPTGFIILGIFGALINFLAIRDILIRDQADLMPIFSILPWLLLVVVAVISARSFAEEKKSGTFEVLMTLPLKLQEIVLGKFAGLKMLSGLTVLSLLPTIIAVFILGKPDPGVIFASLLAAFLFAQILIAIGMYISTTSKNTLSAVFVSIIVFFIVMIIGSPLITDQFPRIFRGIFFFISPMARYQNMAQGVIDLKDVIYFISVIAAFLYLSIEQLKRNR